MLISNKPHCNPRLPKPNLNILLIYFSKEHHALNKVFRLLNTPKFQTFSTESNMVVKVDRYFLKLEAAIHICLQTPTRKCLFVNLF